MGKQILNGIEYCSSNQGGGSSGHNYSTTEQVIGTWIDGKPLYEKVVTGLNFTPQLNTFVSTGINISNIEFIVRCGFAQNNNGTSQSFVYNALCKCDSSGNVLAWFFAGSYNYEKALIQYTKSTD